MHIQNGLSGIRFIDCDFDGIPLKVSDNATVYAKRNRIRNTDVGLDIEDNGRAIVSGLNVEGSNIAGTRVSNGDLIGHDLNLRRNRNNLDLKKGSRGDLFDSTLKQADDFDVRYDKDVLFGLYNTPYETAHDLARSSTAPNLGQDPILDTTSEQLWAEKKAGQTISVASFLGGTLLGNQLPF